MATRTKTMSQIRNILILRRDKHSIHAIVRQLGIARNTIRNYLRTIDENGYSVEEALKLDDEKLAALCYNQQAPNTDERHRLFQEKLPGYIEELKKAHVTRQILWEEYRREYPEGYGYTRFCHYLGEHIGQNEVTAIFTHVPGEKLMVDFAGDTMSYIDPSSGELIPCPILVTVLPYSSYLYVEALDNQRQPSLLKGLQNNFSFLGGVSLCIVVDNMKTAVKKANRYEPAFTEFIEQLSLHYGVTFMATRVRKPRDKATVESSVNTVYHRIYARLRNRQFFSLKELNQAILEEVKRLNERNFKGKDYSRKDLFEKYERNELKALPTQEMQIKKSVSAKVQKNYHIIVGEDWHQYSVPWRYAGKQVKVIYTTDWVEVYWDHKRIALHKRDYRKNAYTTLTEHMPENHKAIYEQRGWDGDYFLKKAGKNGPYTRQAIKSLLAAKTFPEQTYNSCLGILRLADHYGQDRLEQACKMAVNGPKTGYGIINNILKNNMDKLHSQQSEMDFKTPDHNNTRGPENYY